MPSIHSFPSILVALLAIALIAACENKICIPQEMYCRLRLPRTLTFAPQAWMDWQVTAENVLDF
jgi:hypothetical protein